MHLVIIGTPCDNETPAKIAQHTVNNKYIHISLKQAVEDIPIYLAVSDALVVPHASIRTAGTLDIAYLWYCYEKIVIVPDLPRFQDIFPSHAGLAYDPGSHLSFVQALQGAIYHRYRHTPEERSKLDMSRAWKQHAQRIQTLHGQLFQHRLYGGVSLPSTP